MNEFREFERLVARIESALVPTGAIVKSPDYLRDTITGKMRQVDASIRYRLGSVDLLITVECRDRVRTEDVTWIEQLATKQKHVGAAHTVAVSSTGFSEPAKKAAHSHGISVRTIAQVADADILAWADTLEVDEVDTKCILGKMVLVYDGAHHGANMDAATEQQWRDHGWDAPIFIDRPNNVMASLANLVARTRASIGAPLGKGHGITLTIPPKTSVSFSSDPLAVLASQVPPDGSTVQKAYWLEFVDEDFAVNTTRGCLKLQKIGFEVTMSSTRRRVALSRVLSYSSDRKSIAEFAERDFQFGPKGERWVLTLHRLAATDHSGSKGT